ncbi:hypothetical protein [Amycolatopsis sp. YIM 10]|uniref:hypothetical protein n=1 Tax=Amycolatopsis sp. YIM 10 TaxID=2653857 RepID=UPI00129069AA|nr:hypothetical protein [Amycolatopsis sp. YIM 10]
MAATLTFGGISAALAPAIAEAAPPKSSTKSTDRVDKEDAYHAAKYGKPAARAPRCENPTQCDHQEAEKKAYPYQKTADVVDPASKAADAAKAGADGYHAGADKQRDEAKKHNNRGRSGNPAVREPAKNLPKARSLPENFIDWYAKNKYVKAGTRMMGIAAYAANGAADVAGGMSIVDAAHKQGFIATSEAGAAAAGAAAGAACGPFIEVCSPAFALVAKFEAGMVAEEKFDEMYARR